MKSKGFQGKRDRADVSSVLPAIGFLVGMMIVSLIAILASVLLGVPAYPEAWMFGIP